VHWEVKRAETFSPYKALEQARNDARKGKMPVVAHRRNEAEWIIVLSAEDFCRLLRRADGLPGRPEGQDDGATGQGCPDAH
jgi:hypothetical protein